MWYDREFRRDQFRAFKEEVEVFLKQAEAARLKLVDRKILECGTKVPHSVAV